MPPKLHKSKKSVKQQLQRIVPLYQILIDESRNTNTHLIIRDIHQSYQSDQQHHSQGISKTFLFFLLKISGLSQLSSKLNWAHINDSLKQLLDELYETTDIYQNNLSQIIFNDEKHPKYSIFKKALKAFITSCISSQTELIQNTDLLQNLHYWIHLLLMSKLRHVRASILNFASILFERQAKYQKQLWQDKNTTLAKQIIRGIQKFVDNSLPNRLKDVDQTIRKAAYKLMNLLLEQIQGQLITKTRLSRLYYDTISQLSSNSHIDCLNSMASLFQSAKHFTLPILNQFAQTHLSKIEEYCLFPNKVGIQAQKLLIQIQKNNKQKHIISPKLVSKVFEVYAYEQFEEGLPTAVKLFYQSISDKYQEIPNLQILIDLINIISLIGKRRIIKNILKAFFNFNHNVFKFNEMFQLLISEQFTAQDQTQSLNKRQIESLLIVILQYVDFIKFYYTRAQWKKQIEEQYNNLLLKNTKQILLDKLSEPDKENIYHLYLQLFSSLFSPVQSSTITDFIINRMKGIFDSTVNRYVINQVVKTFNVLKTQPISSLCKKIDIKSIKTQGTISKLDLIKISAIITTNPVKEFLSNQCLQIFFNFYSEISQYRSDQNQAIKMELLGILFVAHQWKFKFFLQQPEQSLVQDYYLYRKMIFPLFFTLLEDNHQAMPLRLQAFVHLCKMLCLCSNNQFNDNPFITYHFSSENYASFLSFVEQAIPHQNNTVLISLMAHLSMDENDIKKKTVQSMMQMFSYCHKIACNPAIARYLFERLDTQQMNSYITKLFQSFINEQVKQNKESLFVYWRFVNQVIQMNTEKKSQQLQPLINKLIDIYFKKKQSSHIHKKMLQKIVLFVADRIDHYSKNINMFSHFRVLEMIMRKVYRRYNKTVLSRLSLYLKSKTSQIKCEQIESLVELMNKVSTKGKNGKNNGKKIKNKKKDEQQDNEDSVDNQSVEQTVNEIIQQEDEDKQEDQQDDIQNNGRYNMRDRNKKKKNDISTTRIQNKKTIKKNQ